MIVVVVVVSSYGCHFCDIIIIAVDMATVTNEITPYARFLLYLSLRRIVDIIIALEFERSRFRLCPRRGHHSFRPRART